MYDYYIPAPKQDSDEDGNPCPSHDCCDYLELHEAESVEPHGERFLDSAWVCEFCGEKYTDSEVEQMMNPQPQKKQPAMQGNLFQGNEGVA
jgi:C4-type Zn-finger protein